MTRKTRVLFLINSLAAGGAERQLCQLAQAMDRDRFDLHVAVLYDPGYRNRGELWPEIAAIPGVRLHSLHKRQGVLGYLTAIPRLIALTWRIEPDVLHGYLQGNLAVLLVGHLLRKPIVWGIRRTSSDLTKVDPLSKVLLKVEVWLSRFTDLIVFNSEAGSRNYRAMGMRAPDMKIIPNGFDVARFAPDPAGGLAQRKAWGVSRDAPLIGIAGRLDPVKDHPTFLRMAARLLQEWPAAWFVCVGHGDAAYLESLQETARTLGIAERVLWPGVSLDMPQAYNAFSALVLSSTDEGFPNVLGEAMACGIPCITTSAGDAAMLVGDTGPVCAFGDDQALARAASSLLREPPKARAARAAACRARISTFFSSGALARSTERALLGLLDPEAPTSGPAGEAPSNAPPSGPRYMFAFDDLHVRQGMNPSMAVIPDNRDPKRMAVSPATDVRDRMRRWQGRAWASGLHGFQHPPVNWDPGSLGFSLRGESAGLGYADQLRKLRPRPAVFSPGTVWVPQLPASMRSPCWGVWSFCCHAGAFVGERMETFRKRLEQVRPRLISLWDARALGGRHLYRLGRLVGLPRKALNLAKRLRMRWAS